MTKNAKLIAYVALVLGALVFGIGFYRNYAKAAPGAESESPAGDPLPTNALATNNASSIPNSGEMPEGITNAAVTNVVATNAPADMDPAPADPPTARPASRQGNSRIMLYGAGLLVSILGLGILGAYDISHYFAHRVERFVFEDEGEGRRDPEYEEAEQMWANGEHLEAIRMMREHLKAKPREQYVALRIAEIYEKDLGNPLAAALEYEEILQKNLPREKWGWTAIHLANLYSGKLNRVPEAEALLRRIIAEYPETPAAQKARERFGELEPPAPPPASTGAGEDPTHNLPPGFRPKS